MAMVFRSATDGTGDEPHERHGPAGQRDERLRRLAQLVRRGAYDVSPRRLAAAILAWDPPRAARGQSTSTTDERRAYMPRRRQGHAAPAPGL